MNGQDRCTCVNGDDNIPVVSSIDRWDESFLSHLGDDTCV